MIFRLGARRHALAALMRPAAAVMLGSALAMGGASVMPTAAMAVEAEAPEEGSEEIQERADEYVVETAEELSAALEKIEKSDESEATIVLKADVTPDDTSTLGVADKRVTYESSDGQNYDLNTSTPHLLGDVTIQNVTVKGSSIFAEGHTLEFGESYSGTGLKLYGGSDKDLDLTTNGDADGSTHLIIRAGKFKSIVGGNKDMFTQGKYHEYADWSDPNENKHTTLTGNVLVEIYGGSFGGSYNIDVGDTCCNTDVTPCQLYGGGLGSDTVGDITINVYGLDAANNYNCNIVGGGFGMAGGEDDQTLYNDAIKHTGIVDGNVNLNLLGGDIAEFYGGGWHGGSAYKKQSNVSTERAAQRQYHREEVAVVTGDVNIVMGGDMTLCQNQSQGWGGSYASTIGGDINITIKDSAKLAAKYSLNNDGAPTPENMGELDGKYAQYYDGMYSGVGWDSGFYACGQYDIICGSVNLDIEGGYAWNIQGTPFTDPFAELPVAKTEIRNEKDAPYGIDITVSGGMVHDLWGDNEGGKIADGIRYTQTGGEVFGVNVFDGRNSSLSEGSKVDVVMSGGVVYNMVGQYGRMRDGVTSSITFLPKDDAGSADIARLAENDPEIKLGYLVGFHQITAGENSRTLIDAVEVMNEYKIELDKYGADSDVPFYKNVYGLSIKPNALLTTCKNKTTLLGDANNEHGTWLAYGPVTIGENASGTGGTILFNQPALVNGDAAWTDGALILVPVVQEGSNYDGVANTDIALTVKGSSSGSASVRTVDVNDYKSAVDPAKGDNYVLSKKNGNEPAQEVYKLENSSALSKGLYLKRVNDPVDPEGIYMWQVATGISVKPANIIIYMGGKDGADGVVDEDGNITGSKSLPEPGFTVTLPEGLEADVTKLVFKEENGGRTWQFVRYDGETDTVYKLVPWGEEQEPTRVQFKDSDGKVVTSDKFAVGEHVNQTLEMSLYKGSGSTAVGNVVVQIGDTLYDVNSSAAAKLTVRGTTDKAQTVAVSASAPSEGKPGVMADADTEYTINGGDVKVSEDGKVSLLFDEIIDHKGENRSDLLETRAKEELGSDEKWSIDLKYLDLVDANNGNAWVKANKDVTIYWPLPEGADKDDKFTLLHFEDLHRDMDSEDIAEAIAGCDVSEIKIVEVTDTHVVFKMGSDGFSPVALAWAPGDDGPDTPTPPVTDPDEPGKPDPDPDKPDTPDEPDTPEPDDPDEPDEPDTPEPDEPDTPDEPDEPDTPDTPEPDEPDTPEPSEPSKPEPSEPAKPSNPEATIPQTGDALTIAAALSALAGTGVISAGIVSRRRRK